MAYWDARHSAPPRLPHNTPHPRPPRFSALFGQLGFHSLSTDLLESSLGGPFKVPRDPGPLLYSDLSLPSVVLEDLVLAGVLRPAAVGERVFSFGRLSFVMGLKPAILYDGRTCNMDLAACGLFPASPHTPSTETILADLNQRFGHSNQDLYWMSSDISKCYHSMRLPPPWTSVFGVLHGRQAYCFNTLPFGFAGAPYICQSVTSAILRRVLAAFPDVAGFVYLDDFLLVGTSSAKVLAATTFLRSLLTQAGFNLIEAKNQQNPTASVTWLGKVWSFDGSVVHCIPTASTVRALVEAIHLLQPAITKRELQRLLGKLCWAFCPGMLLCFTAPLFNALYDVINLPDSAVVSIPPAGIDLALQGLHMAMAGSPLKPTLFKDPSLSWSLSAHPPASVACSRANLVFVDYAGIHNMAACVIVTMSGLVYAQQWRLSGVKAWNPANMIQQYGELAALAGSVYMGTQLPGRTLVFGDNLGSLYAMLRLSSPNIKGRSYWLRRLARGLWHLALTHVRDMYPVELGHCPGTRMPADPLTRTDGRILYPTLTYIATVPVIY